MAILFLGLVLLSCDETTDTEQTTSSQQSITYSEGVSADDCGFPSPTEQFIDTYIDIFETMQTSCGKKAFDEKLLLPPQLLDTLSEETLNFRYGQYAANYYYAYLFKATNKVNNNYLQTLKEKLPFTEVQQTANQVNKDIAKLPKEKVWELIQTHVNKIGDYYSLNKKEYLTLCILYGGFIETTYLACMAYEKKPNQELKDIILHCNKIMIEPIYLVSDIFKKKPFYYEDIIMLKKLYDKVQITDNEKVKLNSVGETVIETSFKAHVSDEDFKKIFELSKSIRQKYVTQ